MATRPVLYKGLARGKPGWHAFWISAELLLFVAFISGFYAIVHKTVDYDDQIKVLEDTADQDDVNKAVKSLAASNREVRAGGFVALTCTVLAFIMITVVSRILHVETP